MAIIPIPLGGGGTDTSMVTAGAGDVLAPKVIVGPDGEPLTGTIPDNGGVEDATSFGVTTDGAKLYLRFPAGYYSAFEGGANPYTRMPLSDLGAATAAQVLSGKTFTSTAGVKVSGTLAIQSAISFSAAARSYNTIRISWKNPAKGPFQGVKIRMATGAYPGTSGGTLKYTGTGSSSAAGETSYVDITGLAEGTTYYFTCFTYVTNLGNGTSYNVTATTPYYYYDVIATDAMSVYYFKNDSDDSNVRGELTPTKTSTSISFKTKSWADNTVDSVNYMLKPDNKAYDFSKYKYVYFTVSQTNSDTNYLVSAGRFYLSKIYYDQVAVSGEYEAVIYAGNLWANSTRRVKVDISSISESFYPSIQVTMYDKAKTTCTVTITDFDFTNENRAADISLTIEKAE